MLLAPGALQIVEALPPLRLAEPVEGLDATDALPPLLRPGVLTDLDGYAAWEQACVATFARADLGYHDAIDVIADATSTIREWRPGTETLSERVHAAFRDARAGSGADPHAHSRAIETVTAFCAARVAEEIVRDHQLHATALGEERWLEQIGPAFDAAIKNYLAARVFANWIAYQGRGLRSIVEWLRTCAALVRHHLTARVADGQAGTARAEADFVGAVRAADSFLLHVADTQVFARRFAHLEGPDPR
jgi:hypothetical protein